MTQRGDCARFLCWENVSEYGFISHCQAAIHDSPFLGAREAQEGSRAWKLGEFGRNSEKLANSFPISVRMC